MTCLSATTPKTFKVLLGAPITYSIRVKSGDPTAYSVAGELNRLGLVESEPPDSAVASVADFSVAFVPASGSALAYWALSLTGVQCQALGVGRFISNASLSLAGAVALKTEPVVIEIEPSVI